MQKTGFLGLFKVNKPVLGMIHLKGESRAEKLALAAKEIDLMADNGIDGVIIENYFGSPEDVEVVLREVARREDIVYGLNVLDDDVRAFELAGQYDAKFIQLDSVAGHLVLADDAKFHAFISRARERTDTYVLGGVRFKYQPYLSGRPLPEDLRIGMDRSDAIVVTGDGTGMETDLAKIREFRAITGDFSLVVGAGLTAENCRAQMAIADAAIIGSYLKDTYRADGIVCAEHIRAFMGEVRKLR